MTNDRTDAGARPRVGVAGPVLPFRGGIAQHTTMLIRSLRSYAEVDALSYRRLYPKLLFPGASDRDPALHGHEEPGVAYVLDSLWPGTWRRAATDLAAWRPDAVVLPWWTWFLAPCTAGVARRLRRAGVPVVLLCHNVLDHEAAGWKAVLTKRALAQASWFVTQTHEDAARLRGLLGDVGSITLPHPAYDHFPAPTGALPRRAALELLFFGFVRPYKGLDVLLEAMTLVADLDVRLTVAGEFWSGRQEADRYAADHGLAERVEFVDRYLPDTEVAEYFERADVVVLPYRSATGSGVIATAYRYGRPVIATTVGGLPDVIDDGETGLLVPPEDAAALAAAIRRLAPDRGESTHDAVARKVADLSWDSYARVLAETIAAGGPVTSSRPSPEEESA